MKKKRSKDHNVTERRAAESRSSGHGAKSAGDSRDSTLSRVFAIDPRSLALFRLLVGVLLLADLIICSFDLEAMYTDDGMFSRAEICRRATTIWNWSFHFGGGSAAYQAALFCLAGGLALGLILGIETRIMTIGSWLMLVSLHHRVPPILSGAENLLRVLLFWAMFLPLAQVWSVDSWLGRRRNPGAAACLEPVRSMATAAILLQMAMMYFFSALFKSNAEWWRGEALLGTLRHDFYASPAAGYFLQFPSLLTGLTWATLILEWAAPFLLFVPRTTIRLSVLGGLIAMHVAIGISLEVGVFSHVAVAGLSLFLPAEFWNHPMLARLTPMAPAGSTLSRPAQLPFVVQAACAVVLVYVVALNINTHPSRPLGDLAPERWRFLARGLGLQQMWGMFGTTPSRDGWCIAKAQLRDGSEVDLLRPDAAIQWSRPEFPAAIYPNHYWQKLFREMTYTDEQGYQLMRAPVAEFLCRRWNAQHPPEKQIAEFDLLFATQTNASTDLVSPQLSYESLLHLDFGDRITRVDFLHGWSRQADATGGK